MSIAEQVKRCGVVGAGGAGFPTHIKLSARADTVIVNGAECEPLLGSDRHLLETEGVKVVRGLELVMKASGARKGYVALKRKHARAVESVADAARGKPHIELFPVDDFYPAGDEFVLVHEVTGRLVPEGGIPPEVECLVDNVETVLNVGEAVAGGKAVTMRHLTCTGDVRYPSVVKAHIGTPVGEIVALCGGPTVEEFAFVIGGPLMGSVSTDADLPVTKTTSGVIVLPRDHALVRRKTTPVGSMMKLARAACCQCTYCTELCPRRLLGHGIEPHRIMRKVSYGIGAPDEVVENAALCSGCGLCEAYACVMGISPCAVNRALKVRLAEGGIKPSFAERGTVPNPMARHRRVPSGRIVERLGLGNYAGRALETGVKTDPGRVEILTKQGIGAAAVPVVKMGDRVGEGELVARAPDGAVGAPVHASIGGRVTLADGERIIVERTG